MPAASGQAEWLTEYEGSEYPNKKRSFASRRPKNDSYGSRKPNDGSYSGPIGARQLSAAAAASATVSPSEYLIPNAVC